MTDISVEKKKIFLINQLLCLLLLLLLLLLLVHYTVYQLEEPFSGQVLSLCFTNNELVNHTLEDLHAISLLYTTLFHQSGSNRQRIEKNLTK